VKNFNKEKHEWEQEKMQFKREIDKMEKELILAKNYKLQLRQQQLAAAYTPGIPMKAFPLKDNASEVLQPQQTSLRTDFSTPLKRHSFCGSVPDLSTLGLPMQEVSQKYN
jgi:hypothetical protein